MEDNSEFKNRMEILMWIIGIIMAAALIYAFGEGALQLYKGIFLPFYHGVGRFMNLYGNKTIMAFMAIGISALSLRAMVLAQNQLSHSFQLNMRERNKKITKLEDQVVRLSEKLGQSLESKNYREQIIAELKSRNEALRAEVKNLAHNIEVLTAPEKVAEAEKREEQTTANNELKAVVPYVYGVKP